MHLSKLIYDYLLHESLRYFWVMIKVIAYILAFYTISLSGIPCQDEMMLSDEAKNEAQTVHSASDNHDNLIDLCSPFCVCACCASVTLTTSFEALPKINITSFTLSPRFAYRQPFSAGDPASIWQPPKNLV